MANGVSTGANLLIAWRITSRRYDPLDATGARMYGGRWNPPGVGVVYSASSKALAFLETFWHRLGDLDLLPGRLADPDRFACTPILIPHTVSIRRVGMDVLGTDWRRFPAAEETQRIGKEWYEKRESCVLMVPSTLIPREWLLLLNPEHDHFTRVIAAPPEAVDHERSGIDDLLASVNHRHVFLSHASEDKEAIARPLYNALTLAGISCWYDEAEIRWSDSVPGKVQKGMASSRYMLVVLTPGFLAKPYAVAELHSALHRELNGGTRIVYPVVAATDGERSRIFAEFGLLADRWYLEWTGDPAPVVEKMREALDFSPAGPR